MKFIPAKISLLFLVCISTQTAFAAGFQLLEQSGEGVGNAYAGASAGYGDGSEIAYNPAAMTWLEGTVISHSSQVIIPKADFENQGTSNLLTGNATGGTNDDGGVTAYVPTFYAVHQLNDSVHLGLGISSPFGLKTEYDKNWVGRYHGVESELVNISISPALSIKLDDNWAFGAAANIMYADATLSNAIDFGSIGVASLGPVTAGALGLSPEANDGFAEVTGDDWATGYTLGLAYKHDEQTYWGISYHSRVRIEARGDADFTVPAAAMPLTASGFFTDTSARGDVTLPDYLNIGMRHHFNDKWTFLAETAWTHWSRFQDLTFSFGNGQPDSTTQEDWKNTWRYSFGLNYVPVEKVTLKVGFTYDETAIPSAQRRTPRIPGNTRKWAALGLSYDLCDNFQIGLDYAHLFVSDSSSDIVNSTGNNFVGNWDAAVDIIAINGTYVF